MSYSIEIKPSCKESINKLCKKNPVLKKVIEKKIKKIIEDPLHFKPLKYMLSGQRRVHIMKSFVLKYEINEKDKIITFIFFGHHDEAYER
jgi:YafQ family addiction module toxin component